MTSPFVISAKFTLDGSSVTASANDIRAEFGRLDAVLDSSARKAVELQTALDTRSSSAGAVGAYQSTLQQIRVEQQLESQRLSSQITDRGRAESINRLAQLARDAAAASQALARAEGESAVAAQRVSETASMAAASVARLADQQQRVSVMQVSGLNERLGVRDDFGGASRAADIEAYGRELDELRTRYNPLFALEQRHASNIAEITRAQRLGAISAREMASAVRAEEAAYARSVAAINSSTDALQRNQVMAANGAGQFSTANVAAQFQDIAVTSAMGMAPLQIALQQGTQISAAFGNMGAAGAVKTLGAAFMSIVSPVSLVTIGLVAGAAAAIQYFSGMASGAQDVDERLDEHLERIQAMTAGYDDAGAAAEDYLEKARRAPAAAVVSNLGVEQGEAEKRVISALDAISTREQQIRADLGNLSLGGRLFQDILDASRGLDNLGLTVNSTSSEVDELWSRLTLLSNDPSAPEQARQYATDLLSLIEQLTAARQEVGSLGAAIKAIPAEIRIKVSMAAEFGSAMKDLQALYVDPRSSFDVAREEASNAAQHGQATAQSYSQLVGIAEEYQRVLGSIDAAEAAAESKKTARSSKEISAYDRQLKTIQERTAAQQTETNVIGLGTYASERARMVLELENAAREDAIGLSAGRAAQIQDEASAYALAAAAQEKAVEAQRLATEQYEFGKSTFRSFFSDLKAGLKESEDGWAAFANAGASALDRIADRALGMMADGIFDMIFGAVLGSFGGGMGSGMPGISSITGSSGGFFPGFAEGGWTGGVAGQARGVVHGEEFVVRAGPAAQHRGLLESINAGGSPFSQGGSSVTNNYINAPGSRLSRAEFEAILDARDQRQAANAPTMMADARHRAARGTS